MTIKSQTEYEQALEELWSLWDSPPNTPEQARFIELTNLVEDYERAHHDIPMPAFLPVREWIVFGLCLILTIVGMIGAFVLFILSFTTRNIPFIIIAGGALYFCSIMANKTLRYMIDDINEKKQ